MRDGEGRRAYGLVAASASVLVHAVVIALLVATGGLAAHRPSRPDHVIAIVNLEDFRTLPPAPPPQPRPEAFPPAAQAAPPPLAPPPGARPAQAPSAAVPGPEADRNALHEELGPAEPGGGGMAVATGAASSAPARGSADSGDGEYLPQFRISEVPVVPAKEVLSKIEYPALAAKQGIEATVYLELYIDKYGKIVKATVLKDPGFGFAEAAVKALVGVVCTPAKMNGEAVAVRFRYPVRFTLK